MTPLQQPAPWWERYARGGIVGLGPLVPSSELAGGITWPTQGREGSLHVGVDSVDADQDETGYEPGTSGHSRAQWIELADAMIARWTVWRAQVAALPPEHFDESTPRVTTLDDVRRGFTWREISPASEMAAWATGKTVQQSVCTPDCHVMLFADGTGLAIETTQALSRADSSVSNCASVAYFALELRRREPPTTSHVVTGPRCVSCGQSLWSGPLDISEAPTVVVTARGLMHHTCASDDAELDVRALATSDQKAAAT